MRATRWSVASVALFGATAALLLTGLLPPATALSPNARTVASAAPDLKVQTFPGASPAPSTAPLGWPGGVAATLLPNYNGSLAGNFRSSVTTFAVGTPAWDPLSGTFWWPQFPAASGTTPSPPTAPAFLYAAASHAVSGIARGLANSSAIAYDPAHDRLYATEPFDNTVAVVNASTGGIAASPIPVGRDPTALGLDPASGELFVANTGSGTVSVIDTESGHVSATVPVGSDPASVAVDALDGWVFVANAGSSNVSVINLSSPATLEPSVSLPNGPAIALAYASGCVAAVTPSSGYLTVLKANTSSPAVLSALVPVGTGSGTVVTTPNGSMFAVGRLSANQVRLVNASVPFNVSPLAIPTAAGPTVLTADPSTGGLLVFASGPRTIAEVNLSSGTTVTVTPTLAPTPGLVVFDAAANRLYVADPALPGLEVLDAVTGKSVQAPVRLPAAPTALAFDSASGRVYVALSNLVEVLNGSNGTVLAQQPLSGANGPMAIDPASGLLWVGRPSSSNLVALNLSTLSIEGTTGTIGVLPGDPSSITFDPALGRMFVLNGSDANSVRPFNGATGAFAGPDVYAGPNVTSVAFDPADGLVYAAGDSLSAFSPTTFGFAVSDVLLGPHVRVSSLAYAAEEVRLVARTVDTSGGGALAVVDGSSAAAANSSLVLLSVGLGDGSAVPVAASPGGLVGSGRLFVANAGSGTVSVVAEPPSIAAFAFVPGSVDVNGTTETVVAATGGAGPVAFSYAGLPPGCDSASTAQLACVPTVAGTFAVTVTVEDGYGEAASASATLEVDPPLSVRAAVGSPAVTESDVGVPLPFTANASGGSGSYSFSWAFGDGELGTGPSVTHAFATTGVYAPTVTVVDSNGASGLAVLTISIVPPPVVFLPADLTTDAGRTVELSAEIVGGTAGGSGTWTFDDHSTVEGLVATHAWERPGVYTVSFSYVDGAGVETGGSTTVTVHAPLTATFNTSSGRDPVRPSTVVQFTAAPSGGTPSFSVNWSFGDGSSGFGSEVSHSYARVGNYTVNVSVSDGAGSVVTSSFVVVVAEPAPIGPAWVGVGTAPALVIGVVGGATIAAVALFVAERAKHRRPRRPPTPYEPPAGGARSP